MPDRPDILISVHGRFAKGMMEGSKGVELRRRAPRVAAPTRMWIYEKAPIASVRSLAILHSIDVLAPSEIWTRYGDQIDLAVDEFEDYASNAETLSALVLDHIHHLHSPVTLQALRSASPGFHPPQFYLKLPRTGMISKTLSQQIACSCDVCNPT
jgi:predicted transcriptional regulator